MAYTARDDDAAYSADTEHMMIGPFVAIVMAYVVELHDVWYTKMMIL